MLTYFLIGVGILFAIFICIALAIASFSGDNYLENLKTANDSRNSAEMSTLDYVSKINEKYFFNQLKIDTCEKYKDHYSRARIALSEETMASNSLASFAIVSHELGHARQHLEGTKLSKHYKLRAIGKKCGFFFLPFLIVGFALCLTFLLGVVEQNYILYIGICLIAISLLIFIFAIVLKFKEIQIEKEASDYAIEFLKEFLTPPEILKCKKFLNSARMTYWASLFKTLLGWTMLTNINKMFK